MTTGLVAQGAPAAAPVGGVPPDLRRALDEIESYVSMGFVEDAKGVLDEVGGRFAGHPALVRRLAELGLEVEASSAPGAPEDLVAGGGPRGRPPSARGRGAAPAGLRLPRVHADDPFAGGRSPAPPPRREAAGPTASTWPRSSATSSAPSRPWRPRPPATAGTDLGDASLADIFREFQKGVDKQLGKEDYETRYNLGIAYKEMGLVDEAIAEFQLAAKDEARLLECASMLGMCFVEKGMPKLAVKWFEKGLSAPGRTDEEYKGIRYDLGDALEQSDELDEGLAFFEEVYGQDATFRDVAERIERLREKIRQRDARR